MDNKRLVYFSFFIMIFAQASSIQAEDVFRCPSEISMSWDIPSVPEGWTVSGSQESHQTVHYLVSLTFSDGPPEDGGFLRPGFMRELEANGENIVVEKYDFSYHVNPSIWLLCMYGNTPAILKKRIPKSTKFCEVTRPNDLSKQEANCH